MTVWYLSCVSSRKRRDVELLHLQQGRHDSLAPARVSIGHHVRQGGGQDLPRYAESVFEPAALLRRFIAAGAEAVPVVVQLLLGIATHLERDRFIELEYRASIQGGE